MGLFKKKYSREEVMKKINEPKYRNCTPIEIGNTGYYEFIPDNIAMKQAREELKRKRFNNQQRENFLKEQNGDGAYLGLGIQNNLSSYQKSNSELNYIREAYREDY